LIVWLFAVVLISWGNLLQPLIGATAPLPGGSWQFVAAGAALVAVALLWARALGLDAAALGMARPGAARGALLGALAGGAIAAIGVALLQTAPTVIGVPVVYGPLLTVSGDDLARHAAIFLPLGAVLPEEVAFRGTLLAALVRAMGRRAGVTASALTFALWHTVVAFATLADTSLGQIAGLWVAAAIGALVILFAGGVVLGVLRLVSGSLSTSIATHWAFNAVILVGLWAFRTGSTP
jgi:membrane protease YdiL (CAAX protease family)